MATVKVTLGQPAFVNGAVRQAGEVVEVDEVLAEALAYVPKAESKAADKSEEKKAEK